MNTVEFSFEPMPLGNCHTRLSSVKVEIYRTMFKTTDLPPKKVKNYSSKFHSLESPIFPSIMKYLGFNICLFWKFRGVNLHKLNHIYFRVLKFWYNIVRVQTISLKPQAKCTLTRINVWDHAHWWYSVCGPIHLCECLWTRTTQTLT